MAQVGAVRTSGLPPPTALGTARRAVRTLQVMAGVLGQLALDRLQGPVDAGVFGRRLAAGLERLGATAIKLGQQLSLRADVFPPALTRELERLTDRVPPLPWDVARACIEAELGAPLETVFRHINPQPVGAASVACVYRAALRDGREVAVKVQRPGVARAFSEDLAVMSLLTRGLEGLTLVRAGLFRNLRTDMRLMFAEEMDFRLEARYQRNFRRVLREAEITWITAPRVISHLSTPRLIVTEFVEGVSGRAVLEAAERGDTAALAAWGVDPERIGRRFMLFSGWARLQATLMHVDPHPGNLIVQPGNRVVLIDFGACGTGSRRSQLRYLEVMRLSLVEDPAAIARVMLSDIAPLPPVDTEAVQGAMEAAFARYIQAMQTPGVHWSERILAGLWIQMLDVTREHQIQLNLDTVRAIRAFMLYDTVSYRLAPDMGRASLARALADMDYRAGRAARDRLQAVLSGGTGPAGEVGQLLDRARAVADQIEPTLSSVTQLLEAIRSARDVFLRQVTRGTFALGAALCAWGLARGLRRAPWGGALLDALPWDAGVALMWVVGIFVLFYAARVLVYDLARVER